MKDQETLSGSLESVSFYTWYLQPLLFILLMSASEGTVAFRMNLAPSFRSYGLMLNYVELSPEYEVGVTN